MRSTVRVAWMVVAAVILAGTASCTQGSDHAVEANPQLPSGLSSPQQTIRPVQTQTADPTTEESPSTSDTPLTSSQISTEPALNSPSEPSVPWQFLANPDQYFAPIPGSDPTETLIAKMTAAVPGGTLINGTHVQILERRSVEAIGDYPWLTPSPDGVVVASQALIFRAEIQLNLDGTLGAVECETGTDRGLDPIMQFCTDLVYQNADPTAARAWVQQAMLTLLATDPDRTMDTSQTHQSTDLNCLHFDLRYGSKNAPGSFVLKVASGYANLTLDGWLSEESLVPYPC